MRLPKLFLIIFLSFTFRLTAEVFFEKGFEPWGSDGDLTYENPLVEPKKGSLAKKTCVGMIRFFQVYISPIDGPRSSYYPTSSQYALEATRKYGVFKGIALGCDRLMRENKEMWVYDLIEKHGHERKFDPVR